MVLMRMGSHGGVYTRNQARMLQNMGLEYGGERILEGFSSV